MRELINHVKKLHLPYGLVSGCGPKSMAILAEWHTLGVHHRDLRTARAYIPDLSAAGIQKAYDDKNAMHLPVRSEFAFAERAARRVHGYVAKTGEIDNHYARFLQEKGGKKIIVESKTACKGRWQFPESDEDIYFCNHTAAMLYGMVVDPAFSPLEPMTLAEWKKRQNFSDAIITTGDVYSEGKAPLHVHTELLTEEQRARFGSIVTAHGISLVNGHESASDALDYSHEAYPAVMSDFLNVQQESSGEEARLPEYNYARSLARAVLHNEGYTLTLDRQASATLVGDIALRLSPLMSYQLWLDVTSGSPSAA
jgi:hypothetical protein